MWATFRRQSRRSVGVSTCALGSRATQYHRALRNGRGSHSGHAIPSVGDSANARTRVSGDAFHPISPHTRSRRESHASDDRTRHDCDRRDVRGVSLPAEMTRGASFVTGLQGRAEAPFSNRRYRLTHAGRLVQCQGEALGGPTGFHKFIKVNGMGFISSIVEPRLCSRTSYGKNNMFPD